MKLPSSRPGDDASLLRRTSQVRVLRRQPVIKSDGWTSGEVLGPSSRRDGFDSRTVYQHAGLAHVAELLASTEEPAGSWPAPCSGRVLVVFNSSMSVSKTEGRGANPCGDANRCFASVDSDARPS